MLLWHNSCPRMKIYGRWGYNARPGWPGASNKVGTLLAGAQIVSDQNCGGGKLSIVGWSRECDITGDRVLRIKMRDMAVGSTSNNRTGHLLQPQTTHIC